MSSEKIAASVVTVVVLCLAALIGQCSHNVTECKKEAVKAGSFTPEQIRHMCSQ
jgi:hypothetical protein